MASAHVLRQPSVVSRVFHTEVTNQVFGMRRNGVEYQNDSEYKCEGESGGSEFV